MWCDIVNDVVFQFIQSKIWLEQINHIEQCLTIFKWTFFVWSVKRKAVSYKALGTIEIKWLTFEYVSFDCDSRMWTWNVAGHNGSKMIKIKKNIKSKFQQQYVYEHVLRKEQNIWKCVIFCSEKNNSPVNSHS